MLYRPPILRTANSQTRGNNKHVEQGEEKFTRFIDDDIHQIAGGGLILFRPRGEHPHITAEEAHSGDDGDTADKKQDNTDQNRIRFIRAGVNFSISHSVVRGEKQLFCTAEGARQMLSVLYFYDE